MRVVGDVKLLARAVEGIDLKDLRSLADEGKKQVGSGVVAIVGVTEEGKAGVVVGVTADLTARFSAVDLVRKGAEALGGKGGGGRPDMAQAGGPDGSKAEAALKAIEGALGRQRMTARERRCSSIRPRASALCRRLIRTGERLGARGLVEGRSRLSGRRRAHRSFVPSRAHRRGARLPRASGSWSVPTASGGSPTTSPGCAI